MTETSDLPPLSETVTAIDVLEAEFPNDYGKSLIPEPRHQRIADYVNTAIRAALAAERETTLRAAAQMVRVLEEVSMIDDQGAYAHCYDAISDLIPKQARDG